MKNKGTIKYSLSLILSIGVVVSASAFACLAILMFSKGKSLIAVLCALISTISLVLMRAAYNFRVQSRDEAESEKSTNNKYSRLSKRERHQVDLQVLAANERIISSNELRKVTHEGSKKPLEELNELVGLHNIKESVARLEAQLSFERQYQKKEKKRRKQDVHKCRHMCFLGPPGTGKTTVARIMTGILYKYGCIKENRYVEIDAAFLKGINAETTLQRTRRIMDHAKGAVLFIDEAYSLADGSGAGELIAEIVKFMEDNKKDFCLILAGYKEDTNRLLNYNPGLKSRINQYFEFSNFNSVELRDIFSSAVHRLGFCVSQDAYDAFDELMAKLSKEKNFGNARSVQNIAEKAAENHAYEVMQGRCSADNTYVISAIDLKQICVLGDL